MRDPNTVAAIVNALRQVHGDELARVMLNDGLSLAVLIDALLCSPLKNRDAVKLITRALSSGDFIVTPDFGSLSHLKYFYDRPKSLHVVDIAVTTGLRTSEARSAGSTPTVGKRDKWPSIPLSLAALGSRAFGDGRSATAHTAGNKMPAFRADIWIVVRRKLGHQPPFLVGMLGL